MPEVTVDMRIDVALLILEKQALLRAIEKADDKDAVLLDGILNMLDHIHDTVLPPN